MINLTNPKGPDLIIIGCGQQKLNHPAPARDLYISQYFRAKRAYAEASGCPWVIASAAHGLVLPGEVIEPYDRQLEQLTDWDLYWWRWHMGRAIVEMGFDPGESLLVELHCGELYRQQIKAAISKKFITAEYIEPLVGMGIGNQLSWYKERRVS